MRKCKKKFKSQLNNLIVNIRKLKSFVWMKNKPAKIMKELKHFFK